MPGTAPRPKSRARADRRRTVRPRPRRAPPAASRPGALEEAAEELGELFDESIRHLLLSDAPAGWRAGPVRSLGIGSIEPGTLGWSVTLERPIGTPGSAGVREVGTVYLFVLPRSPAGRRRPDAPPLVGHRWTEFGSVDLALGPPRILLASRPAGPTARGPLRIWARALFHHLVDELG